MLKLSLLPEADESAQGFLWRLSAHNGYVVPSKMKGLVPEYSQHFVQVHWTRHVINLLAGLTSNSSDNIDDIVKDESSIDQIWHESAVKDWVIKKPRLCLSCISEPNSYIKSDWNRPLYNVCTRHGEKLISACPSCKSNIVFWYDLRNGCRKCNVKWDSMPVNQVEIPKYQIYWDKLENSERRKYRHVFCDALIKAARPHAFSLNQIYNLDVDLEALSALSTQAFNIIEDPAGHSRFRFEYWKHLNGLNLETVDAIDNQNSLSHPFRIGLVDAETLAPTTLLKNYANFNLAEIVDMATSLKLLNLDYSNLDRTQYEKEAFHAEVRRNGQPVLKELPIQPLREERQFSHQRYGLNDLNDFISKIPIVPEGNRTWTEIRHDDLLLKKNGQMFTDLINAAIKNEIKTYRMPYSGLQPLFVDSAEYEYWLEKRLKEKCKAAISLAEACRMTSLGSQSLLKLGRDDIIKFTRGDESICFCGKSFYDYLRCESIPSMTS